MNKILKANRKELILVCALFFSFHAYAQESFVLKADNVFVPKPSLIAADLENEMRNFTASVQMRLALMSVAYSTNNPSAKMDTTLDLAYFLLNQIVNPAQTHKRIVAIKVLKELVEEGYLSESDPTYKIFFEELNKALDREIRSKTCGQSCEVKGLSAILQAAVIGQTQPSLRDNMENAAPSFAKGRSYHDALLVDYGSDKDNITVAVYMLSAIARLEGAIGVYNAALELARAANSPRHIYKSKNYRQQIAAVELLSSMGPQGYKYLKELAWFGPVSRVSRFHAAVELAYTPLPDAQLKLNKSLLEEEYCLETLSYAAYAEPLFTSVFAKKRSGTGAFLETAAYAYGGGSAPSFVTTQGSRQCLPVVPHDIPSNVKADKFIDDHGFEIMLTFVPFGIGQISFGKNVAGPIFKALTMCKVPPKKALSLVYKIGYVNSTSGKVVLSGEKYIIENLDLSKIKIASNSSQKTIKAAYPATVSKGELVRGMRLGSHSEVSSVLEKGLDIEKVSAHNNALLLSTCQNPAQAVMVAGNKQICFTGKISDGVHYATRPSSSEVIPVVTHINNKSVGLKKQPFSPYVSTESIAPEHIRRVSVYLEDKGGWGQIELLNDGRFLFSPYK